MEDLTRSYIKEVFDSKSYVAKWLDDEDLGFWNVNNLRSLSSDLSVCKNIQSLLDKISGNGLVKKISILLCLFDYISKIPTFLKENQRLRLILKMRLANMIKKHRDIKSFRNAYELIFKDYVEYMIELDIIETYDL